MTQNGGALSTLSAPEGNSGFYPLSPLASLGGLCWYAVQTRSRHEKRVVADLQEKAVRTYLPLCRADHQWSDRRKLVETPLFPGYVFVNIAADAQARVTVLQTNGVISFLGVRGIGTSIPESEIAAVQTVLQQGVPVEHHPFIQVGQRIRIRGGSLDGLEGLLSGVEGKRNLVVSIELIERSIAIRLSGFSIEPVDIPENAGLAAG